MQDKIKRYKCKYCKESFEMYMSRYAQRSMTGLKGCCLELDCMTKAGLVAIEKQNKADAKAWKKRKAEGRKAIKNLTDWKDDLQEPINWIARELDKNLPCISHPDMVGFLRYDAGHYHTVKSHSDVRFNLHNIHKQNSQANEMYGGDGNYVIGLTKRYGAAYAEMVINLPLKYKGIGKEKYTIANIRDEYLPRARQVQRDMKNGVSFTRDQVNEIIGIYK